jgi:hypothetical protein
MKLWTWIGGNHEQLKVVFAIIAGLYVFNEYMDKVKEARLTKSLEYVKRFKEPEIATARDKLDEFWNSKPIEEWQKVLNRDNYDELAPKLIEKGGLRNHVRVLGTFYRELGLCLQSKMCDQASACLYFFTEMQAFRHNYKWQLEAQDGGILTEIAARACIERNRTYCQVNGTSQFCRQTAMVDGLPV